MVHEYTQASSILSVSSTRASGVPASHHSSERSINISFIFVPFVSLAKILPFTVQALEQAECFTAAMYTLWLANVMSSPITITLFFSLQRLAKIRSRSFRSKNLTRTGLDLVPVGVPVLWATSMSVTAVLTLAFWLKMSQHFFLQSSVV